MTTPRRPAPPTALAVLTAILTACGGGGGGEPLLPFDTAWCNAEASLVDPLPELFAGAGGVDEVVLGYVSGDRYSSGIAIATVSVAGTRFHAGGQTRWDQGVAVDADTAFEIGSVTKLFTALLLADAVLRGEVSLDEPCNLYLPPDAQLPSRNGHAVELRHLATHTAGLPRDAPGFTPGPYDPWYAAYSIADFHAAVAGVRLATDPGTRWSYSNMGFNLLGHILSLRTGMSYEELVATRILVPLGMTATSLHQEPAGIDLATPYHHRDVETDTFMLPVGLEGAGGIRSTARDLARFARAALGLEATPLDGAFELAEALHFRGPSDGGEVESGLAWARGHAGGDLFVGHGGGTWGFTSSVDLDRTRQLGTIVLTNSRHARDCLPGYLAYWIDAWQRTAVLDPTALAAYRGEFTSSAGRVQVELDGERLAVTVPGHARQRIQPEGGDRFFSLADDLELRFDRDSQGRLSGVSIRSSADPAFSD